MNEAMFLKMIFDGYVQSYGSFRWHTHHLGADMTQRELYYFADLGTKLGFVSKREHSEIPPLNYHYSSKSNPRDLVWIDQMDNDKIFLHLERENKSGSAAVDTVIKENKLKDSARYGDNRYLVGVFGFLQNSALNEIKKELIECSDFRGRDILIIAFCGDKEDHAQDVVGLVYSKSICYERHARAEIDKGGYWYLFFEKGISEWQIV